MPRSGLTLAVAFAISPFSLAWANGSLTGTVKLNGKAPPPAAESHASDPSCGETDAKDESLLVSKDGKVANVVIRVLDAPAPAGAPPPSGNLLIKQSRCTYRPRVQVAQQGQTLKVENDDPALHNVHAYAGAKGLFNVAQPPGSPAIEKPSPPNADVVKVKCDVHPWMTAYVVYNKTPYSAVSFTDGKYTIKSLPAGTYQVEAWHEKLGRATQSVTVKDGRPTTLNFELKAPSP